jgi:hydrogenase nickel incorporation protein HypA/HybF
MHELSLAQSVVRIVRAHRPDRTVVRRVRMQAGPMRGIVPEAMQWAWQAHTQGTELEASQLELDLLPWTLQCDDCGRQWTTEEIYATCGCGSRRTRPVGGDELAVLCIDVDPEPSADVNPKENRHESAHC